MKKILHIAAIVFFIISFSISIAGAKWWIFGQSEEMPEFRYLYLNGVPYEETGRSTTFYRDNLPGGMIMLKGKASIQDRKIGLVQVSIDGKNTWLDARLSQDGSFEYGFRPEAGKTYQLYIRAVDTTGKANDVEKTFKEVNVAEINIQTVVRYVLDNLISAYKSEDPKRFMSLVSDDFVGDKVNLDRAIRKDFTNFDNIDLRYTLNNVSSDSKSKIYISLNFNRMLTSVKSGRTLTDNGMTEFILKLDQKYPTIYSMKWPIIFGVSDPQDVATGSVQQASNQQIIVVNTKGDVSTKPASEAQKQAQSGSSTPIISKNVTINIAAAPPPQSYDFATETLAVGLVAGDIGFFAAPAPGPRITLKNTIKLKYIGVKTVDSITEVDDQNTYALYGPPGPTAVQGQSYALYLANGKYVAMEIFAVGGATVTIRYKYQPNGTRYFQ
jgi:hypothetical protein